MVLQVNMDNSIDAILKMSQAHLNTRQSSVMTQQQKHAEQDQQEKHSDTQRQARDARARADTSTANAEKLMADTITKNAELYDQYYKTDLRSQMAEKWNATGAAKSDMFYRYLGPVDTNNIDSIHNAYVNIIRSGDEGAKEILKSLPPLSEIRAGNPEAIAQLKLMQMSNLEDVSFRQKTALQGQQGQIESALTNQRGRIESGHIQERGNVQSRLQREGSDLETGQIYHRGNVQMGLQQQEQGWRAEEVDAERVYQTGRDAVNRAHDIELKGMDIEASIRKAQLKAVENMPELKDILNETSTNWKTKTIPARVNAELIRSGFKGVDEEVIKAVSADIGDQSLDEWHQRTLSGERVTPQQIADERIKLAVASQQIAAGEINVNPLNFKWSPDRLQTGDPVAQSIMNSPKGRKAYIRFAQEPEFHNMSEVDRASLIRRALTGG